MDSSFTTWYDADYPLEDWDGDDSLSRKEHMIIVYQGWQAYKANHFCLLTLGEESVNRAKQLFIKKGELTVSNLKQSNRTMFGSLTKEELHEIIHQVANQCLDTSELTTTKHGSPKLTHVEAKEVVKQ